MAQQILLVGLGGFFGSVARYLVWLGTQGWFDSRFPIGTFLVNLIGCFVMGAISVIAQKSFAEQPAFLLFFGVGILGGFTTFSAFGLDTFLLWKNQGATMAIFYATTSVVLGFVALALGRAGMEMISRTSL